MSNTNPFKIIEVDGKFKVMRRVTAKLSLPVGVLPTRAIAEKYQAEIEILDWNLPDPKITKFKDETIKQALKIKSDVLEKNWSKKLFKTL